MPVDLDTTFVMNIDQLTTHSADVYAAHKQGFGGTWSIPYMGGSNWQGDLFDFTLLGEVFDRSEIANQYNNTIANSAIDDSDLDNPSTDRGTLTDVASLKMMNGMLEQREQAFRARHSTPIMNTCYAAARRKGHGSSSETASGVFGVMLDHVFNVINHGR